MTRDASIKNVLIDKIDDTEIWLNVEVYAENEMEADAIAESYSASVTNLLNLGGRLREAAASLPPDAEVTEEEMRLVTALEGEVDSSFGKDARLYGRAVALYAVRDLSR